MSQTLALVSLAVRDYDEAIRFYVEVLGFELMEDTPLPGEGKRWVVVAPPGSTGARLLLARATKPPHRDYMGVLFLDFVRCAVLIDGQLLTLLVLVLLPP